MRVTKQDVQGMFKRFLKTIYSNSPESNTDVFDLEYNSTYGGYIVEQRHMNTSVSHPFISKRLPAKEMYDALHMACTAIEYYKYKDVK